ncbi:unnamed protein product, partial [Mesorhabditis spiculigera]
MALQGLNSAALKAGDPEPAQLERGKFRLYNMRFCPWAERALLYAAAKGIDVEIVNINLQDKPEWYFEKHYQGKVPTLEYNGKCVIESSLIPQFLDDLLPENSILPKDAYDRVHQKILAERNLAISTAFYGTLAALKDPGLREEKMATMNKALDDAENLLKDTFFGGKSPSYADYLTFPFLERTWWASHIEGVTGYDKTNFPCSKRFPKLTKWFNEMLARPEVAQNLMPVDTALAFLDGYRQGKPNYDEGI